VDVSAVSLTRLVEFALTHIINTTVAHHSQEEEQIQQLENSLREAGFREYDVLLETQQLQDELIALRYACVCICIC